jgi:putative membrane protein
MSEKIDANLILREKLAIERTEMANDGTLLSFIRTSLYFQSRAFPSTAC